MNAFHLFIYLIFRIHLHEFIINSPVHTVDISFKFTEY